MNLYLMRHGEARSKEVDRDRPLTEEGRSEVVKIASFINIKAHSIWVSNKLRAQQTAEILKEHRFCDDIVEREDLAPNDPVNAVYSDILNHHSNLIIVGHIPFLPYLASNLLSLSEDSVGIDFNTASVLSLEGKGKSWVISWLINADLITV